MPPSYVFIAEAPAVFLSPQMCQHCPGVEGGGGGSRNKAGGGGLPRVSGQRCPVRAGVSVCLPPAAPPPPSPSHMAVPSSCLSSPALPQLCADVGCPCPPFGREALESPFAMVLWGALLLRGLHTGFARYFSCILGSRGSVRPPVPFGKCLRQRSRRNGFAPRHRGRWGVGPRAQWLRGHPGGCTRSRRSVLEAETWVVTGGSWCPPGAVAGHMVALWELAE